MSFYRKALASALVAASITSCGGGSEGIEPPDTDATPTPAPSAAPTPTPETTAAPVPTDAISPTPTETPTSVPSVTATPAIPVTVAPTVTSTPTVSITPTATILPTATPEVTATPTATVSPTATLVPTSTPTPTNVPALRIIKLLTDEIDTGVIAGSADKSAYDPHVGFRDHGSHIDFNTSGDWADYRVKFQHAGVYRVELDYATPITDEIGVKVFLNMREVASKLLPATGGEDDWATWVYTEITNTLEVTDAGEHTIRVQSYGASPWQWNARELAFEFIEPLSPTALPTPTLTATPVPTVTSVVTATPTVTPLPIATPETTPTATATPVSTAEPTATPTVTSTPIVTPTPTESPTVTPTATQEPVVTPTPCDDCDFDDPLPYIGEDFKQKPAHRKHYMPTGFYDRTGAGETPVEGDGSAGFAIPLGKNGGVSSVTLGEWAEYDINFDVPGYYSVKLEVGFPEVGGTVGARIYLDGEEVATTYMEPTGGWAQWKTYEVAPAMHIARSGGHTIKIETVGTSDWQWSGNYFSVMYTGQKDPRLPQVDPNATPITQPIAGGVDVQVNLDVQHIVGGIGSFERPKFITMHSYPQDRDWIHNGSQGGSSPNDLGELLMADFLDGRDVYFGRDTGDMKTEASSAAPDTAKPGWANTQHLESRGLGVRNNYVENDFEWRNQNFVLAAQSRPFYPDGQVGLNQFSFSSAETPEEPFGSALGHFLGNYTHHFFKPFGSNERGASKPKFVEVMNEPIYDLVRNASYHGHEPEKDIERIFRMHAGAAKEFKKFENEALIGGYTTAFPDYEAAPYYIDEDGSFKFGQWDAVDFGQWEHWDKRFLEIAGEEMGFISIHLYDFPNIPFSGKGEFFEQYRKGSYIEGILDMLEAYMSTEIGELKPIVISEYGTQMQGDFGKPWNPERDWFQVKAFSSMMMQFMQRPDRIGVALPFVPVKADGNWAKFQTPWGRNTNYPWRLMVRENERETYGENKWVYSDVVYFYDLWKDVNGKRVDTWSSDPDIQVDAYVENAKLFLIANNLEFQETPLNLHFENGNTVKSVKVRHLYQAQDSSARFVEHDYGTTIPSAIKVAPEATAIIIVEYENSIDINEISTEEKYFSPAMVQEIVDGNTLEYTINSVTKGVHGEAILRLGVGRHHDMSLTPVVTINGTEVIVPKDFRGYDQKHDSFGRPNRARVVFFGVLEIPVDYSLLLEGDNTVRITFEETDGKVSTVGLQTFEFSRPISRP